jgi:hypothetical protein
LGCHEIVLMPYPFIMNRRHPKWPEIKHQVATTG